MSAANLFLPTDECYSMLDYILKGATNERK